MKQPAYIIAQSSMDVLGNSPGQSALMFRGADSTKAVDGKFEIDDPLGDKIVRPTIVPHGMWRHWEKINKIGAIVIDNLIKGCQIDLPEETAIVFSTQTDGLGNFEGLHNGTRMAPRRVLSNGRDFLVGYINKLYGFKGVTTSLAAACATSLYNLEYAMRILDEYEFVIVGAADAGTSHLSMEYFRTIGAIGTHSAPFDKSRDGFIMGEGGAAVVVCNQATVKKYGLRPIAVVHDVQLTNDGMTGSPTNPGEGGYRAMQQLPFGVNIEDLAFVKAHGTSTPIGDPHEVEQITKLLPFLPIVSYKSMIGHTIGSSGLLEMLHSIAHLKAGVIPGNRNINERFEEYSNIITEHLETRNRFFINNAFGFGGKCASALVEVL